MVSTIRGVLYFFLISFYLSHVSRHPINIKINITGIIRIKWRPFSHAWPLSPPRRACGGTPVASSSARTGTMPASPCPTGVASGPAGGAASSPSTCLPRPTASSEATACPPLAAIHIIARGNQNHVASSVFLVIIR